RPLAVVVLSAAIGSALPASAQTPGSDASRPITLVVAVAAGGGVDTIGRVVAERVTERLKQPVGVGDPGRGGGPARGASVAKAAPAGRTLLLLEISAVLHKWLHKSVPFDVTADFAPIAQIATTPLLIFSLPSFAPDDAKELIANARANPGKLLVGTPGV